MRKFLNDNKYFILLLLFMVSFVFFISKYIYNQKTRSDQVIAEKSDSIRTEKQIVEKLVYIDRYKPKEIQVVRDTVVKEVKVKVPVEYEPTGNENELKDKLTSLSKKHYSTYNYKDSLSLKDSLGREVGYVNLDDKVSENKIDRGYTYQLKPFKETLTINNTKTIRQGNTRKLAIGIEASYDNKTPYTSTGAGLMYSDKKGNNFQFTTGKSIPTNNYYFRAGYFKTLSFR